MNYTNLGLSFNHNVKILGSEIIDTQWKQTLTIMNLGSGTLIAAMGMGQTLSSDRILPLLVTIAGGGFFLHFWKVYFAMYVAPTLD